MRIQIVLIFGICLTMSSCGNSFRLFGVYVFEIEDSSIPGITKEKIHDNYFIFEKDHKCALPIYDQVMHNTPRSFGKWTVETNHMKDTILRIETPDAFWNGDFKLQNVQTKMVAGELLITQFKLVRREIYIPCELW